MPEKESPNIDDKYQKDDDIFKLERKSRQKESKGDLNGALKIWKSWYFDNNHTDDDLALDLAGKEITMILAKNNLEDKAFAWTRKYLKDEAKTRIDIHIINVMIANEDLDKDKLGVCVDMVVSEIRGEKTSEIQVDQADLLYSILQDYYVINEGSLDKFLKANLKKNRKELRGMMGDTPPSTPMG